jgi:hypothetical protein
MRKITPTKDVKDLMTNLHVQEKLVPWQISERLKGFGISISTSTVKNLLDDWGVYDLSVSDSLKYSGSRRKRSDETKERMSKATKKRWDDGSCIGFTGRTHSPETYEYWTPFTSKAEFTVKERLEKKGYCHQYKLHIVGLGRHGYTAVLDFYHKGRAIVVEIDGAYHFEEIQRQKDIERDNLLLKEFGIRTIRIDERTMKVYKVTK